MLLFREIMATQSRGGFKIHREIPIYKKRTLFSTKILAKTIEVWEFSLNFAQIGFMASQQDYLKSECGKF